MKKILFLFCILCSFKLFSQIVEVSEMQTGTWDADTILVVDDVTVPKNESLTILAGTKVIFNGYYKIIVDGELSALGTAEEPISFTVIDTTGFYKIDCGDGGWGGITFYNCTGPILLEYCNFSYGKAVDDVYYGGAVRLYNIDNVIVDHCNFINNMTLQKGGGLYAEYSNVTISNCDVGDNKGFYSVSNYMYGGGLFFINCTVEMKDMYIHDNYCPKCYGGGVNFDSCNVNLDRALIENNTAINAGGLGIQRSSHLNVVMSNVILNHNNVEHYGGGMACAISSPTINNFVVVNNTCGAGGGGVQFYGESYPIFNNCIFWGNGWNIRDNTFDSLYSSQICIWSNASHPSFRNGIVEFGQEAIYNGLFLQLYEEMSSDNPMFVDLVNGDYHLQPQSPAIDSGTPDTTGLLLPDLDFYCNPRISNNIIDIGVHEFLLFGDANDDGIVDVLDILSVCSYIFGDIPDHFNVQKADANHDNIVNVLDIQTIITMIFDPK